MKQELFGTLFGRFPIRMVILAVLCVSFVSCSTFRGSSRNTSGARFEDVVGKNFEREEVNITIARTLLQERFQEKELREALRVVKVFRRGKTRPFPEYRLFDVRKGSPYDLLGLKSGDIVLAADGWIVFGPEKVAKYAELLQFANTGSFVIDRDGKLIELLLSIEPFREDTTIPR